MNEQTQTSQAATAAATAPESAPAPDPKMAILGIIANYWTSRCVYIAAKLGIADLLKVGPKSIDELASATGTHARSLRRVMRALTSTGMFIEQQEGVFATTPIATALETDLPGSMRYMAITELGEEHYEAWGDLMSSVRTGCIAFDEHYGMSAWEHFDRNPESCEIFAKAMTGVTEIVERAILKAYDFSKYPTIVDVGGGEGRLLCAALEAAPASKGILLDRADVIERAKNRIRSVGKEGRIEAAAGSFFESVPEGGDLYMMKWIIHDWEDSKSQLILSNCRKAMKPTGRLIVIDSIVKPGNDPDFNKFMDVNMLVMTGGCERTEAEFRDLLASAGFRLERVIPTESPVSIIEAVPA